MVQIRRGVLHRLLQQVCVSVDFNDVPSVKQRRHGRRQWPVPLLLHDLIDGNANAGRTVRTVALFVPEQPKQVPTVGVAGCADQHPFQDLRGFAVVAVVVVLQGFVRPLLEAGSEVQLWVGHKGSSGRHHDVVPLPRGTDKHGGTAMAIVVSVPARVPTRVLIRVLIRVLASGACVCPFLSSSIMACLCLGSPFPLPVCSICCDCCFVGGGSGQL